MSHIIIDRRKNDKGKSTENRRRFLKRVKKQIKESIKETIRDGKVGDIVKNKNKKIKIPGKGLDKPTFKHSKKGGVRDYVSTGNKKFNKGDRIPRPQEKEGKGKEGSNNGEGEDDFSFHLTKDEFLDFFFEDLALPDMVKKNIVKTEEFVRKRAGFSVDGNPSRLNILQSLKKAKGRRLSLKSPKKKKLKKLINELEELEREYDKNKNSELLAQIEKLKQKISALKKQIKAIAFIDDMDLRYNRWENFPVPTTQAVMFGIMDVSASMGEWEKEMAKRFFMLMLLFLHYNYERVDIVWIRHHTIASEVDEEEFFYSKETGGTIVSSALHLMNDIIKERYPIEHWNVFACQISDGDNWRDDNLEVQDIMQNSILPKSQYFAYVEVDQYGVDGESDLWPYYERLKNTFSNLEMSVIHDVTEIYPVFRKLFEKKD